MTPKAKSLLVEIANVLQDRLDSAGLWHVLTALRGPDMPGDCLAAKFATVGVIRARAFGSKPFDYYVPAYAAEEDTVEMASVRCAMATRAEREYSHFVIHARAAFQALELSWHSPNGKIRPLSEEVGGLSTPVRDKLL